MQLKVPSLTKALALAMAIALPGAGMQAQSLFAPVITVNDDVITRYELDQRIQFLTLLRAPGDPAELARKALIDERLRMQAVRQTEIKVTEEQIKGGIDEFAARTELSGTEFLRALAQGGVDAETMRDFVRVGLAWREYVRQNFIDIAQPSRDEIERAMAEDSQTSGVRVLLSEIIIPITPQTLEEAESLAKEISQLRTYDAFAAAAHQYSAADTRDVGGRLPWMAVTNLPEALRPVILALKPGETTAPIPLPNAVAVFQMRGIGESAGRAPRYAKIDYAVYYMAGGRSPETLAAAQALKERVDRCDDLYTPAKGQPADVLERRSEAPSAIPRDIALELAHMDNGEVSTSLTRNNGQTLVFLMMCKRTSQENAALTYNQVADRLTQQRVNDFADAFIAKQRAEALIVER